MSDWDLNKKTSKDPLDEYIGVRRLVPSKTRLFLSDVSTLNCKVTDEPLYQNVHVVRFFPIRHPNNYVGLRYTNEEDKDLEIGVIEDPLMFSEEQKDLIFASLRRQYYEQVIGRIIQVKHKDGLLTFHVETQRGRESFIMPWRGDRAEDYGDGGKLLLDAFDNRFIIRNVKKLPFADQQQFYRFIYW